jgi:hypothetical protein
MKKGRGFFPKSSILEEGKEIVEKRHTEPYKKVPSLIIRSLLPPLSKSGAFV